MPCSEENLSFRAKVLMGEKRIETRRGIRNVEKNIFSRAEQVHRAVVLRTLNAK